MHVSGKTRTPDKYRVVYTDHQRLELEKEYQFSKYITIRRKAELAQALSLSERQVGPSERACAGVTCSDGKMHSEERPSTEGERGERAR